MLLILYYLRIKCIFLFFIKYSEDWYIDNIRYNIILKKLNIFLINNSCITNLFEEWVWNFSSIYKNLIDIHF